MKAFLDQLERNRTAANLALVSLVAVLFVAFQKNVYAPISETAVTIFQRPFLELKLTLTDIYRVRERNHDLRQALMRAMVKVNELETQKEENERLRAQLGYDPPPSYRLIPLEPVSVRYRGMPISIQVNKGEAHGLKSGLPVINSAGLVGRIDEVTARYSTVQLLTDPGCRVAGRVAASREQGIARFIPGQGLILDNTPIDAQIHEGDMVVSSGLGGVFPEGLPVGVVTHIERNDQAMFAKVQLEPTVRFNAVDELYALALDTTQNSQPLQQIVDSAAH